MTEVASIFTPSKGRHGAASGPAGVSAREVTSIALASIAVRKGQATALRERIKARTGVDLPASPRVVTSDHLSFVWSGPGLWFAMADGEDGSAFADDLAADLAGLASVTNQTDGRVLIRVSGSRVRDALAKGCMIDLHPTQFAVGATANTPIALINVQITRLADADGVGVFELAVMRSFAASLWHWLESSAAEFGLEIG